MKPFRHTTAAGGDVRISLYRRKPGGPVHYCFWWKGKRHRESTGANDESQARQKAGQAADKVSQLSATDTHLPLSAAVEMYLSGKWPSPKAGDRSYRDPCNRLKGFAKTMKESGNLASMAFEDARGLVRSYLDIRKAKVNPVTLHNDRRAISGLFSWLIEHRRVMFALNPAGRKLHGLPQAKPVIRASLPQEVVTRFLDATKSNPDLYAAVILGLAIGMRPRATSRLLWSDIDLKNKVLIVKDKTGERPRPLASWAVKELAAIHKAISPAQEDKVINIDTDNLFHKIKRLRRRAGLPKTATLQALRRTFIKNLWQAGVDTQKTARIAGNSVQVIAKYYAELSAEDCRTEAELTNPLNPAKSTNKAQTATRTATRKTA